MSSRLRLAAAVVLGLGAIFLPLSWGCQGTCGSSSECASDEFCSIANGVCLTPKSVGFCKAKPDACAQVLAPICGCDGKTYSNSCEASIAGVSVAASGVCGAACGGVTDQKCGAGQFCDLAAGTCGSASPTGACKATPTACSGIASPVCGCDQKTYRSACEAAKARVSIFADGECPCGGPDSIACEPGRFCQLAPAACLGPNPSGVCMQPPATCTAVKSPVCGCDGATYDNACAAAKAQVSITGTTTCIKGDAGADGG